MRPILFLLALGLIPARPAASLTLNLPVRAPGAPRDAASATGSYRGDLLEVRLAPTPARSARARAYGRQRADALGVAAVDRLAGRLGAWFEPEFQGETPPPPGSDEPDFTAFYLAHLPPGVDLADAIERFRGLGEVLSADPIAVLPVDAFPNDSLWTSSPWFYQPANRRDIHAPEAWDVTRGDTAVIVAVLDTGVLPYHPDLGGTVAGLPGQIWTNAVEAAGAPGVDDDANGFVDDVHGWDFVHGGTLGLPGEDVNVEDPDPNDYAGHGTMVAGLVGAITNNGIGVAGTAWNVRIMPVRMGYAASDGPLGVVEMAFAARAIRYATRMGATVINCSWASENTGGIDAAVGAAVRAGITVVTAAGNSSPFHYLGDRNDVLAVTASGADDAIASFSNLGPWVDLAAPGVDIQSTFITRSGTDSLGYRQAAYSPPLDGTSFSAPLAAGVVALVQSRYVPPYPGPPLTPRGIQLRLMESADDIAAQNPGLAGQYGAGRLNAYRALTEISGSSAIRTRARSVGPQVVLPTPTNPRVAFLTTNRRLLVLDAVLRDTVLSLDAVGSPNGGLAAADLGGAIGVALFYGTFGDGVFGVTANGGPVAVDWPQPGSAPSPMGQPVLGDVDGDAALDVVSAGADGQVWAWHVDGSLLPGFPVPTGIAGVQSSPALSDLDGTPGVEVVVASADGLVHALRAGGASVPGWPVTVAAGPRSPVITRLGAASTPMVIVAAGNQLHAFAPSGLERAGFPVTLSGSAAQDPALGDLNGDGFDEIVVATVAPAGIEVRDSSGVSLAALNWPRPLAVPAQGPPVLGELATGSPGPELLVYRGGALLALGHAADSLATFPKPGGAGEMPSLAQADADPATEVAAGTGVDSLFYIYDAGPGSSFAGGMPWPTVRGNHARTGSRLYIPPLGTVHGIAPAAVTDLHVVVRTDSSVSLAWTATGDDGTVGRPDRYVVRGSLEPLDEASFGSAPLQRVVPATVDAGGSEYLVFQGLAAATAYWFALKAVDGEGNLSPISNVVSVTTDVGGPLNGREGIALVVLEQPARSVAVFLWQSAGGATGAQSIRLYDVTGRLVRVLDLGTGVGGRVTWDGRDAEGRSVPAGLYHARLLSGSVHTQTRVVLLP